METNDELLVMVRNLIKDFEDEFKKQNGYIIEPKQFEKLMDAITDAEQKIAQLPDEDNPSVLSLMEAHKLLLTENKLLRDSCDDKVKDIIQYEAVNKMYKKQIDELEQQNMNGDRQLYSLEQKVTVISSDLTRSKKVIDALLSTIKLMEKEAANR